MKITIESETVNFELESETLSERDLDYIIGLLRVHHRKVVYDVVLEDHGSQKYETVKTVRVLAGIGLKEAKDLVESAPGAVVLSGVSRDQASEAAEVLHNAGCTVEVQERR